MQFDPEESGEERRKRQRDYHSYLDWQVESRKKGPATDSDVEAARLPALPPAGRLKHQPISLPYGVDAASSVGRGVRVSVPDVSGSLSDGSGPVARAWAGGAADRSEYLSSLEDRLEAEVQRRHLVERKVALLSQKVSIAVMTRHEHYYYCYGTQGEGRWYVLRDLGVASNNTIWHVQSTKRLTHTHGKWLYAARSAFANRLLLGHTAVQYILYTYEKIYTKPIL